MNLVDEETGYLSLVRIVKTFDYTEQHKAKFRLEKDNQFSGLGKKELQNLIKEISVFKRDYVAKMVMEKYPDKVFINYCANCGSLTKSPASELCLKCGYSWFGTNPNRDNA